MDDVPRPLDAGFALEVLVAVDGSTHRLDHRGECLLRVDALIQFMVAPLPVEPKDGNAEFILHLRIEIGVTVFIGDHFAACGKPDIRSIITAGIFLELRSITSATQIIRHRIIATRHIARATHFNVIASRKIQLAGLLLLIQPPG